MPVSFSSFGDIVAVLQLAWQLRTALADASGASAEIQALIIDLDSFTRALQQTRNAIANRHTPLTQAVENGIKHAIIACYDVLRAMLGKLDAFKTRVGAVDWRRYWALAAWSILGGKKEVDALRVRLSEQIGVMQTYLALAQSNDQEKVQATVDSQGVTLHRIFRAVQDIQIRFDVGVPTFHFYDKIYGYYTPFARTSLQRFKELSKCTRCIGLPLLDHATNWLMSAERPHAVLSTGEPLFLRVKLSFEPKRMQPRNRNTVYGQPDLYLSICLFKERAFNEWQVLLGCGYAGHCLRIEVLKLLVERSHPVGSHCRCTAGACRTRLEACRKRANHWQPLHHAMLLINHVEHLAMHWDIDRATAHRRACSKLGDLIYRTDWAFVQRFILPLLRLHAECQRPSLSRIQRICESGMRVGVTCPAYTRTYAVSPVYASSPSWQGTLGSFGVLEYQQPVNLLNWL